MIKSLCGDMGQDEDDSTKAHNQTAEHGQIEQSESTDYTNHEVRDLLSDEQVGTLHSYSQGDRG